MSARTTSTGSPKKKTSTPRPHKALPFPVMAIGASAGGVEALRSLLQHLSGIPQAALIIITHLLADKKSHMDEVLASFTSLPVQMIEEVTPVEPGVIYTIPAGRDLGITDGVLHLLPQNHDLHYRIIDRFLDSLAQDQGTNAICAILSGTGTDGTLGAVHISKAGGMVLVQDPATTLYPGMPASVLETGVADATLSPEDLADRIPKLPCPRAPHNQNSPCDTAKILELLRQHTGQDLSGYRPSTMTRLINKRKALSGRTDSGDYVKELEQNPQERVQLFKSLFIGVTSFFRDPDAFDLLWDKVLPAIFSGRAPDDTARIWIAGCSTGEEAYSVAMLLEEYAEHAQVCCAVKIFATDIDQQAVDTARKGFYPARLLRNMDKELQKRHFNCASRGCTVNARLRERIVFVHHNLLQDPPFLHADLVICRNLLIYLTPPLQEKALVALTGALNPGGFLFLGSAETLNTAMLQLETIDKKWRLFRNRGGAARQSQQRTVTLCCAAGAPPHRRGSPARGAKRRPPS